MNLIDYCNGMGYNTNDFHDETIRNSGIYSTCLTYIPFHLIVTGLGQNEMTSRDSASIFMLEALKLHALLNGASSNVTDVVIPANVVKCEKTKLKEYVDTLIGCGNELKYTTEDLYMSAPYRCTLSHPNLKLTVTKEGATRTKAESAAAHEFYTLCETNAQLAESMYRLRTAKYTL